ncbi:MAG: hypothetical protein KatS3mg082_1061 [Nitrospiraceae bacterium]|nr:MAG: hypothetical protein KatS3mg082_1061 [Nitrospiraceae bacterium]
MTPLVDLTVVLPDTTIAEVLQVMESLDVNQVPVIRSGRFLGMTSRDHLLWMLYARLELETAAT